MKKILLCLALITAVCAPAFAGLWPIRGFLEMTGQYSLMVNVKDVMSVPAAGDILHAGYSPSLCFNGVFMFGGDDGLFALYVKKDHVELVNKGTYVFSYGADPVSAADDKYINVDEEWGMHYVGAGLRWYFLDREWSANRVMPYASADAGVYFPASPVSKIKITDLWNNVLASGTMDATGWFPGFNLEAGADYWFVNEFAVSLKAGYRYCNGTVTSRKSEETVSFAGTLADAYAAGVYYSGFYAQLGVVFNFQRYD